MRTGLFLFSTFHTKGTQTEHRSLRRFLIFCTFFIFALYFRSPAPIYNRKQEERRERMQEAWEALFGIIAALTMDGFRTVQTLAEQAVGYEE